MSTEPLPSYDWQEPARLQENDWDCSVESIEWCLFAWGRTPDDDWIENSMIAAGVVDPAVGCTDSSGAGLASWVCEQYGADGYIASNQVGVSFDDVAIEAGSQVHPLAMGGGGWYHWTGVRNYDASTDRLELANPAPGWHEVYQTMSRGQFAEQGPFSLVRVMHPVAEGIVEIPPLDYSYWETDGKVGSGLIDMMRDDGVQPAQDYSTWLPLGRMPAQIEECLAEDGTVYRWLLTVSRGYRYRPSL